MTAKTKWILAAIAIVSGVLLGVTFGKTIWNWLENTMVDILIYLIVFGGGWFLGRYGNKNSK
ncbi:MAG: hypothetical protein E7148_05415 [Rikenellaceae bacterium]|nr:hypothetical protein [Rikenellaceae bacterium]